MSAIFTGETDGGESLVLPRARAAAAAGPAPRLRSRQIAPRCLASRTVLTVTPAAGKYAAFGRTLAWSDADTFAGNRFPATGKELLIVRNTGGSALAAYVRGAPDSSTGRSVDQVLTIEPGDTATFGPFPANGWRQSDRHVWLDADSALIRFAVIVLP